MSTVFKKMDSEKYIQWLINSNKIVEIRLDTGEYKDARYIIFTCLDTGHKYKFEITYTTLFTSFNECIDYYGFKNLIPDTNSKKECEQVYKSFYPNKEYDRFKIIALKLKYIDKLD